MCDVESGTYCKSALFSFDVLLRMRQFFKRKYLFDCGFFFRFVRESNDIHSFSFDLEDKKVDADLIFNC